MNLRKLELVPFCPDRGVGRPKDRAWTPHPRVGRAVQDSS